MKVLVISLLLLLQSSGNDLSLQKNSIRLADAEKILGEPATLTGSTTGTENGAIKERRTYAALAKDAVTGKTGMFYYNFEQYPSRQSASQVYKDIFTGNQRSAGIKHIPGLGDEAFFHSDEQNFHLLMARKNDKIVRLKVNKVTSHTSIAQMQKIMSLIMAGL